MLATICNQTLKNAYFVQRRLPRGTSKHETKIHEIEQEIITPYIEEMTAQKAYDEGYLTEEDTYELDPDEIIPVELEKREMKTKKVMDSRLVERESKMPSRRKTVAEEVVDAVLRHPFAPEPVLNFVNQKLGYFSTHQIKKALPPFALVFLDNENGSAQVRAAFTVENWQHMDAKVRDAQDNLLIIRWTPEVLQAGVRVDGIIYFPAYVKLHAEFDTLETARAKIQK